MAPTGPAELSAALSTCQSFVSLYSPTYFTRDYCGKEWSAFRSRLEAAGLSSAHSPLILPVLWFPIGPVYDSLPLSIREIQYGHKELGDIYHKEGLQYLLRLKKEEEYQEFLTRFAEKVISAVRQYPLATVEPALDIKGFSNAFEEKSPEVRAKSTAFPRWIKEIEGMRLPDRREDFLTLVSTVCQLREPGAQIERVACEATGSDYLRVSVKSGEIVRLYPVGTQEHGVTLEDLQTFLDEIDHRYRQGNSGLISYLVYGGEPASEGLVYKATENNVRLMSLAEYQGLIDFRTYVEKQTKTLADDKVYDPRLYVPQRLHLRIGKEEQPFDDAFAAVNGWLNSPQGRFVLILGDFGTGKTFLLHEIARRMGERKSGLVPVFLQMRSLEKGRSLDELVAQHFAREKLDDLTIPRFRHMLEQGQIALLFDGFDELAVRVTYPKAMQHFDTLLEAVKGQAKVVVTSRRQHFLSDQQVLSALGEKVEILSGQRIAILQPFDRTQIRSFLVNLCGDEQRADARLALIDRVQDLLGLSSNPRMLSFIAELPEEDLEKAAEGSGDITAGALYKILLERWLGFEFDRVHPKGAPPGLSVEDRWNAVTVLAFRLWQKTEPFVSLDEVSEDTAKVLAELDRVSLDPAVATFQVGSGTLLVRDEEKFSFLHQSVLEWLIARQAALEIREIGGSALLAKREISLLMANFLIDLAKREDILHWAQQTLTMDTSEVAKNNALLLFDRLGEEVKVQAKLSGQDLRGQDLSGQDLTGADLSGANLSAVRLLKTRLSRANLKKAQLVEADLTGAFLDGANLSGANLSRARLLNANLQSTFLQGAILRRAKLLGVQRRTDLDAYDMFGAARNIPDSLEPLISTSAPVHAVVWSPDGEFLVSAEEMVLRLWEADSGREIRRFRGHEGLIPSVAFSPDGKTLASGSQDKSVRLWQVDSGREIQCFLGHPYGVISVAFSPDGKSVASGGQDKSLRLWQVDSGREIQLFPVGEAWPLTWTVAFSPDGKTIAGAGSEADFIRLWDVDSGRQVRRFYGHEGLIRSVAFSPDGKTIASGSNDASVRLWQVDSGQEILLFQGHKDAVQSVTFSPDGKTIASGSDDQSVRLWQVDPDREIQRFKGHGEGVRSVAFSPEGKTIASGSQDKSVRLWQVDSGREIQRFQGYENWVRSVAFSPDGKTIASGSQDKSVRLWQVDSGREIQRFKGHKHAVQSVAFNPDGKIIASGSYKSVRLWKVDSGREIQRFQAHEHWIPSVAFSPDGKTIASGSYDQSIRLWQFASGREIQCFHGHRVGVLSVAFSPDGKRLGSGSFDKSVRLWQVDSGREVQCFQRHEGGVWSVAFSPDGKTVASGSDDKSIRLWQVGSRQELQRFQGHRLGVQSVAFSPDGNTIASGSYDHSVRLWQVDSGREIRHFQGHEGGVLSVAFSSDGKTIASGSQDNTIRLWDVATGCCVAILGHLPEGWVAYTPDGRYKYGGVISGSFWHVISLCRFEVGELDDYVPGLRLPDEASFFELPPKGW